MAIEGAADDVDAGAFAGAFLTYPDPQLGRRHRDPGVHRE